jgi:formamidopyrimidine-DNA glycosylase
MPELPEAETIVRDLRRRVLGRRVTAVAARHADVLGTAPGDDVALTPARLQAELAGRTLTAVERRGKNVVLRFAPDRTLAINLGMTGRVVASDGARAAELRHVAVRLELDDGRALLYDDARRFGRLDLHDAATWAVRDRELGLEPFDPALTPEALHRMTAASRAPIRNWLLDQRRLAGVGNIYASEALHRAGIRPRRGARTLRRAEAGRLLEALRAVLAESIEARGTTISDFRDADGERGGFEPRLRVYDREGLPCPACATPIRRVVLTNRSAFYCPGCQR